MNSYRVLSTGPLADGRIVLRGRTVMLSDEEAAAGLRTQRLELLEMVGPPEAEPAPVAAEIADQEPGEAPVNGRKGRRDQPG